MPLQLLADCGLRWPLQVEALLAAASIKPVVNQVELHPLLAQRKLVGTCLRKVCS